MNRMDTLGQRIQSCRKQIGLSQEALGEQLLVSRQAVSKWESDTTVPELDNLIAMSRIFSVSVGELLGVEPPQPAEDRSEQAEQELQTAEAIAARYILEAERLTKPHRKRRLAITLLVCALFLGSAIRLVRLDRRFDTLQQQVNDIQSSVSTQINAMSGQLQNILTENASIFTGSTVQIIDFDPENQTVTLWLSASPKEWRDNTTACFTVSTAEGEQFSSPELPLQNGSFTAEALVVPMSAELSVSAALLEDGVAHTEPLEPLYDCTLEHFQLTASGNWSVSLSSDTLVSLRELRLSIDTALPYGCDIQLHPVTADLCLYRNQEPKPEQTIPLPLLISYHKIQGYPTQLNSLDDEYSASFTLKQQESMALILRITDNYGQTTYTFLGGYLRENGAVEVSQLDSDFPWQPGVKVYK